MIKAILSALIVQNGTNPMMKLALAVVVGILIATYIPQVPSMIKSVI